MADRMPGPAMCTVPQDPNNPVRETGVMSGANIQANNNTQSKEDKKAKEDIALDITQFILDISGIIDPTPISDGSNALISLARGNWFDAFISAVSIIPFADIVKVGKFPRYLKTIEKAIELAKTDIRWAADLNAIFLRLKEVVDVVYDWGADVLSDTASKTLKQVKKEIDEFIEAYGKEPKQFDSKPRKRERTRTRLKQEQKTQAPEYEMLDEPLSKKVKKEGDGEVNTSDDYGVAFFGEDNLPYYTPDNATIGREGKSFFLMPLEDSVVVKNASDAARYTGRAPSAEKAYLEGGDIFGLSFPTKGMKKTKPTAADAEGWPHYLEGGYTAVKTGNGSNAGYLVNPTREFVVPGGASVPKGSVLFKLGSDGEWMPIKRFWWL